MNVKEQVLQTFNQPFVSRDKIEVLCESISNKGSPFKHCFAFIDGTIRAFYNGHKRVHSIKYQSILFPNGIIQNLFGSVVGRRHDGHLLARSKVISKLERKCNGWEDPPYMYGDSGYPLSKYLIVPFKGCLTPKEQLLNKIMSGLRVTVEWGFAKISTKPKRLPRLKRCDYEQDRKVYKKLNEWLQLKKSPSNSQTLKKLFCQF